MPYDWKNAAEEASPGGRPTAFQLRRAAKEKVRSKRACYDQVAERVYKRVSAKAAQGWTRVVYEVPPFVVGLPPYDREDCAAHLAKALRKDGYAVAVFGHVLYVSWDPKEASEGR